MGSRGGVRRHFERDCSAATVAAPAGEEAMMKPPTGSGTRFPAVAASPACCHRYLRRDGSLGLSGRPDPKRIYLADEILSTRGGERDECVAAG